MTEDATHESLAVAINEALRQAGWSILPMSYFIDARKLPSVFPRQVIEAAIAEHVVADK